MAALRYVHVPNYAAIIFRRSFSDLSLPGAIMDRAKDWLAGSDARWNDNSKTFLFPSGATLTFAYLASESDKFRYQGAEFQFCTAVGTSVVMAGGGLRAVEDLSPGDEVQTLEGPRRVTRAMSPRWERCVRADVFDLDGKLVGSQEQSETHPFLTPSGWQSYVGIVGASRLAESCSPRRTRSSDKYASLSWRQSPSGQPLLGNRQPDHSRLAEWPQSFRGRLPALGFSAFGAQRVPGSGSAVFGCEPQAVPPPVLRNVPVTLHSLPARSNPPDPARELPSCGSGDGRTSTSIPDCRGHCSSGYGRGGEHSSRAVSDCQLCPQQQGDAEAQSPTNCTWGALERTRECSPRLGQYPHPYTSEMRSTSEPVFRGSLDLSPCGERFVVDITVAGVSHYYTRFGLINQNCGFDELTQFTESQYRYLFSRLRRAKGSDVPIRMRSASNPGGIGHEWVKARFISPETAEGRFVPATRRDNPHLDNEAYDASLNLLDPTTKQQLDSGDWDALPPGLLFDKSWFEIVDAPPACVRSARYWDFAATEPSDSNKDPDWTVGLLLGRTVAGAFVVLDINRFRKSPAGVQAEFLLSSAQDGQVIPVGIEKEGGASGKAYADSLVSLLPGYDVEAFRPTGEKMLRARPSAAQARVGNIKVVRASWNRAFLDELNSFPGGGHDDQVDALSGALGMIALPQPAPASQSNYRGHSTTARRSGLRTLTRD